MSTRASSRRTFGRAALAALVASVCLVPAAGAQREYEPGNVPRAHFAAPLAPYPQPSWRAKDFSLVRKGGWYHLFYTRVQRYVPSHWESGGQTILNETSLGHAISTDLETWFSLDSVMTVRPGLFDEDHVWAPHVVERNGVHWLFYTGVVDSQYSANASDWLPRWQSIGVAYSTDALLTNWTRASQPIWQPCSGNGLPGAPWALCRPTIPGGTADFRDPFVEPPAAGAPAGSPWLMYFTARPRTDQWNYVVGVAQTTTGATGPWSDVGALWDTYAPTINTKIESPHVFAHGGLWHLFYTGDDGTTGIVWQEAIHPATGPWESQGPISPRLSGQPDVPYEFTLEPEYWFASEHFAETRGTGTSDYFCVVHSYKPSSQYAPPGEEGEDVSVIEFRQMLWNPDGTFRLVAPSPVRAIELPVFEARVGDTTTLTLTSESPEERFAELDVVKVDGNGVESPLGPAAIGLPTTVPLVDGAVVVPWRITPSAPNPPFDVRVRVVNQPLRIATTLTILPGDPGSNDAIPYELPVRRTTIRRESVTMRDVGSTPLGGAHGILIESVETSRGRLAIYDVRGRLVRSWADLDLSANAIIVPWDRTDSGGRAVDRGIYFARVTTAKGEARLRLLVLDASTPR